MKVAGHSIPKGTVIQVVVPYGSPNIAEIKEAVKLQLGIKADDVECSPCNWERVRVSG